MKPAAGPVTLFDDEGRPYTLRPGDIIYWSKQSKGKAGHFLFGRPPYERTPGKAYTIRGEETEEHKETYEVPELPDACVDHVVGLLLLGTGLCCFPTEREETEYGIRYPLVQMPKR